MFNLFWVFFKLGCISFGGGYAVIPMIERQVEHYNWMSQTEFQHMVSLAGMSPGPIATNSAILIGYSSAGIMGAIAAAAGMILPSLVIIIVIVAFLMRFHRSKWVRSSFYGLKPIVTGLIVYAAIHFGVLSRSDSLLTWSTLATLVICGGSLYCILKFKWHPVVVLILSGMAGIILF